VKKYTALYKNLFFSLLGICFANPFFAQISDALQSVHGNFQIDAQNCQQDTATGVPDVQGQTFRYNAFGNINYTSGDFSMGFRFESYNPVMLGFLPDYSNKSGIPYKYARYKHKDIDITIGNFYEQFGSGLMLRTYEDRGLLYDNSIEGFRAIYSPHAGVTFKGVTGRQRVFWGLSDGIVRGFDGEVNFMELLDSLNRFKTKVILGGSFVSKYQDDKNPSLVLPKNVGCYGGRLNVVNEDFNFYAEYAYKINDPSYQNQYSFKDGQALYLTSSYAKKGFSVLLSGKYIDNMSYRSDRDKQSTVAFINFLPALSKPHTYLMMAYYPYASQPNGEVGGSADIQYKVKKGTALGGKYGMDISLNASLFYGTDTTHIKAENDSVRHLLYSVDPFSTGDKYFHDINIEISKKFSKKVKMTLMYANQFINQSIVQYNTPDKSEHPDVYSNIIVADLTFKYKTGAAIRSETQLFLGRYDKGVTTHMTEAERVAGNNGNWVTETLEWTPTSKWFFVLMDQFNYSNPVDYKKIHYYYAGITRVSGPTRIMLSYGRQRQGIFCAGGVCRLVPAFTGFQLSISSSF
jgi:hypothetical protein